MAQLQRSWQLFDFTTDMLRSVEVERALYPFLFEAYRRGDAPGQQWLSDRFLMVREKNGWYRHATQWDVGARIAASAGPILWRRVWFYQDELRLFDLTQGEIAHARVVVQHRRWSAFPLGKTGRIADESFWNRSRFALSDTFAAQVEALMRKAVQFDTEREMAVAAIALKRHQLRYGQLPNVLAGLVPEFISELPYDWMDGKPLRYAPHSDGTFALYSVGKDQSDNGGDPTTNLTYMWMWDGRDVVWPMPAP